MFGNHFRALRGAVRRFGGLRGVRSGRRGTVRLSLFRPRLELLESRQLLSVAPVDLVDPFYLSKPPVTDVPASHPFTAGDDYGDTFATATSVSVSTWMTTTKYGSIEQSGDVDMFRFVAPVNGWVTVSLNARYGSQLDPYVFVYDSGGNLIAQDDDSGTGYNSLLDVRVVSGATYYVKAAAYGTSTGTYALGLKATSDDYGNGFSSATALSLASNGSGSKTGKIEKPGDQDLFRFVAPISGTMTITQSAYYSQLDSKLVVYNGSREVLASDDNGGGGTNSRVTIDVTAGATYYLKATAHGSSTGAYILRFSTATGGSDDFPNTFSAARQITLASNGSGSQNGSIERSGDVDMFRIVAPVSGTMTITQSARSGSSLDSLVTVYNASQSQIASDDDSGGGRNARVQIQVTAGATYYVKAGAYGTSTGAYTLQFSTTSGPTSYYDIQLVISGMTSSQQQIFQQAAQRWEQIIIGDLPDVNLGGQAIDDLVIYASARYIDGPGGILGMAGPTHIRTSSSLPCRGEMEFDSADLQSMQSGGYLLPVIVHEMGHVIGFGTIWDNLGLLTGAGGSDPRFTGSRARSEYNSIFHVSQSGVPVENTGGSGTRDAHWRESVFDNELMTGWIDVGRTNPLSRVTVASMADLGYQVNMAAADSYTPPGGMRLPESRYDTLQGAGAYYLYPVVSPSQAPSSAKRISDQAALHDAVFALPWQVMAWSDAGLAI